MWPDGSRTRPPGPPDAAAGSSPLRTGAVPLGPVRAELSRGRPSRIGTPPGRYGRRCRCLRPRTGESGASGKCSGRRRCTAGRRAAPRGPRAAAGSAGCRRRAAPRCRAPRRCGRPPRPPRRYRAVPGGVAPVRGGAGRPREPGPGVTRSRTRGRLRLTGPSQGVRSPTRLARPRSRVAHWSGCSVECQCCAPPAGRTGSESHSTRRPPGSDVRESSGKCQWGADQAPGGVSPPAARFRPAPPWLGNPSGDLRRGDATRPTAWVGGEVTRTPGRQSVIERQDY